MGLRRIFDWVIILVSLTTASIAAAQEVDILVGSDSRAASERFYRDQAEMRDRENRDFYDSWARFNTQALQNAVMTQNALKLCRATPACCQSRFKPNPGVHNGPAAKAEAAGKSPSEKRTLTVTATRLLNAYEQIAAKHGFARDEVAAPMAFTFTTAMLIYRGMAPDPTPALLAKVTVQARQFLANDGIFALANDSKRQEQYERLGIIGVYLNAEFRAARAAGDDPRVERVQR